MGFKSFSPTTLNVYSTLFQYHVLSYLESVDEVCDLVLVSHVHVQVAFVREHFSTFAAQTLGRRAFLLPVHAGYVISYVLLVFKPFIALGALMGFVHFFPTFS